MSDMGLSVAASGLAADTALLDTASNNLSNISTPGYAAERVNLSTQASGGPMGVGQGVAVGSVSRLTNAVYAAANVAAQGVQGAATQTSQIMASIESIFPEPGGHGIAANLTALWSNLSTLAANPNQVGAEQAVVGSAQTLASSIGASFTQLSLLSSQLQSGIGSGAGDGGTLAQANSLLQQVAQLNTGIVAGTAGGLNANALTDEGTAAVNKLAGLLGVTSTTGATGSITIYLKGVQLVSGNVAQTLTATGSAATANAGIATSNGVTVDAAGSIGASLTAINTTITSYVTQLNSVADSLATGLNALQAGGMAADGTPGSAIAGSVTPVLPNIFVTGGPSSSTYTPSSSSYSSAATFSVSAALVANPALLATASAPGPGNSNVIGTATFDGTNAQVMAALASSSTGADASYQSMIGALGTQAATATATATEASNLSTITSNNLSTVSGVNQNMEEVNILNAQNAFQASSKVVNAITTCFQSLLAAV